MNTRTRVRSHWPIPRWILLLGVSVVVVVTGGCADNGPTTWARTLSINDIESWGAACGTLDPNASIDNRVMISRSWHGDLRDGVSVLCDVTWDIPNARLSGISFAISAPPDFEPTAELIEPYVQLLEREVPPGMRGKLRALAPPRLGNDQVGKLAIASSHVVDPRRPSMWMLYVSLRP